MANSKQSLEKILSEIQKLEKTEIDNSNQIVYDELFFSYLLIGILIFLATEISRKFFLREVV